MQDSRHPRMGRHPRIERAVLLALLPSALVLASAATAAPFPGRGHDVFPSQGVFEITLAPGWGGGTFNVQIADLATIVIRSDPHAETGAIGLGDVSGPLGNGTSGCPNDPHSPVSDVQIGPMPGGFSRGLGDEVHVMMCRLQMSGSGWTVRAGSAAPGAPESFGEVETRNGTAGGFPAESFFNLFVEVDTPFGFTVVNYAPLQVTASISAFPPANSDYVHSFTIVGGRVALFNKATGCFVGWMARGSHRVCPPGGCPPDTVPLDPHTHNQIYPVTFSVKGPPNAAEGLVIPDPCTPPAHGMPNDVFALGPAVGQGANGYATEGEVFQSSGRVVGGPADNTSVDGLSAALGVGPAPGGPPFTGPFAPMTGAPNPAPAPPGGPIGTLGLQPDDEIDALSYGDDGGDVILFSVTPASAGAAATAVNYNATTSPLANPASGARPSNGGGDPGNESAGDVYASGWMPLLLFGAGPFVFPAPPFGNRLVVDEFELGLQAPAGRFNTPPNGIGNAEDDVDALEIGHVSTVDANADGIPDAGALYSPVFFSLAAGSPSIGLADPFPGEATAADPDNVTADDILVARPPVTQGAMKFAIYARGVADLGLQAGDDIDALAMFDASGAITPRDGILNNGDMILFSLAAGSPSLIGSNPNFPAGAHSAADIFRWTWPGGAIVKVATAANLGLLAGDDVDGIDLGYTDLEFDPFPMSRAIMSVRGPGPVGFRVVELLGPTSVLVDIDHPVDTDGDGLEQVVTEMVQLDLSGTIPNLGPISVNLRAPNKQPFRRTYGEIEEVQNTQAGRLDLPPFAPSGGAASFFDVQFEVRVAGMTLHNDLPKRMSGDIDHKPPDNTTVYESPAEIELLDENNDPSGIFVGAVKHWPNWPSEVGVGDGDHASFPRAGIERIDPNPFDGRTRISFVLIARAQARVAIFDLSGRLIRVLEDRLFSEGRHVVNWDGRDELGRSVPAGIYFAGLTQDGSTTTKRLVRLR